ncbi:ABC transporter permease [Oceanobacillus neutriphilus]|uniref:Glycine betaine/carnitine/choline transport system permease protein OpuCB n=1 Tax=Oceanobacillus neutriphilus TaxID=531815 RepID=A0ABQ2P2T3_9BACI|nr:ABC transporter permease [Oceanobacillus neutriphilus]GGP16599.1 glycine betaine/carnitine/choline transport system permease protein OpuCB [Oceanobacillus neutriphilus]
MQTMMDTLSSYGWDLLNKTGEHLYISIAAIVLGVLVAVPLGILLTRIPSKAADRFISFVGILQTVPSLAILAFLMPFLGVGVVPAIIALFIYSVLPILRNTYTGVMEVNTSLKEAGKGMGMSTFEIIRKVELPLALPVIMSGIRFATVYLIGWATLAAFIGGGGLGDLIFDGLNLYKPELIVLGTVPATILALIANGLLSLLEKGLTPKALRKTV